jgi:hypothetical protein
MKQLTRAIAEEVPGPSFSEWLAEQVDRNDPVGDVARDDLWARKHMPEAVVPTGPIRLRELFGFLEDVDACEGARDAFLEAWEQWKSAAPPA